MDFLEVLKNGLNNLKKNNMEARKTKTITFLHKDEKSGMQLFTEEDLRQAYNYGMFAVTSGRNFNDWFKNFKKK